MLVPPREGHTVCPLEPPPSLLFITLGLFSKVISSHYDSLFNQWDCPTREPQMQIAKLVLEFLKALIWPVTVLLLAWVFKREIRAVLARMRKAVLPGGVSVDFENQIIETKELATRVEAAEPPANRPQSAVLPLTEANSRMITLGLTPTPSGLDMNYYKRIATLDPTLALAGLRIEVEILLKNLAKGFKINTSGSESASRLMQQLRESGAVTPDQFALGRKILSLTNQAVHGRTVSQHESVEIIDAAKALVDDYLSWLSWGFGDDWQPKEPASTT